MLDWSGWSGLGRRALAEFVGTGLLLAAIVGSGIAAARLSPADSGVRLAEMAATTGVALAVIIVLVGPVSGGHLNPAVSLADWLSARRGGPGLSGVELLVYVVAQLAGGFGGTVLANLMFDLSAVSVAATERTGAHLWLAEVVATAGLVAMVCALVRTGRTALAPAAVGGWIAAAFWFTSSTAFANPAVTVARALSDTATGIDPGSVPAFVAAQLVGALVGLGFVVVLYPRGARPSDPEPANVALTTAPEARLG